MNRIRDGTPAEGRSGMTDTLFLQPMRGQAGLLDGGGRDRPAAPRRAYLPGNGARSANRRLERGF